MKKILSVLMAVAMTAALAACGGTGDNGGDNGGAASKYESALDVLKAAEMAQAEDQRFPIMGGDSANMTENMPGAFDTSKTEELDTALALPASEAEKIDDAASMVHMMNANTFTAAAYHLVDGTDVTAFAEAVKENVMAKQWMCGMPDTFIVINVDGHYVLTAFGADEIIQSFKTTTLSALEGAEVIVEQAVAE